ncbi:hypothetical protein BE17_01660 [Sorangium cellulosum]|uniref:Secreted protein n=1 Tax=Sorangium cellulosum TaxID=56 RepID=A0A150QX62_SORCE|nr:hypothetical protein BE17_01660 [Sorangium cellulosum]
MGWSSWSTRHARRALMVGAAVARLSLPGSAAAQEARAPGSGEDQSREDVAQRRERAALLATHYHDAVRLHSMGKGLPMIVSGIGGVGLALSLAGEGIDAPTRIAFTASFATMLGGGLGALAVPETYRLNTLATAGMLSQGSLWLGFALLDSEAIPRMTFVSLSAGSYAAGLLSGLNLALSEYTPVSRLRADHALVATPGWRARLSGAQLAGIERDLLGTEPAIPRWAIFLPVALGGVAAAAPVLDPELPAEKRVMSALFGLLNSTWSLAAMFEPEHPVQAYQRDLRRAGLRVEPSGPDGTAGLTVSGKF